MQMLTTIIFLLGLFAIGLWILGTKYERKTKAIFRKNAAIHEKRCPLTDKEFCEKAGMKPEDEPLVSEIRKALAKRGAYKPDRIYPEDELWETFNFPLGDDIDGFVFDFIESDYGQQPYEKLNQVSDMVKYLIEQRDRQRTKG